MFLRLPATHIRLLICFASGVRAILFVSCLATCAPGRSEGAQKHPAHRALHRVSTASVQGLLAPIDRRSRHRSLSYVSRCANMAWWLPSSVSLGWTGCTAAMWAACRGSRNSAHGAAPVPNLAVPGCTQTPCRSAYRESLVRRFKCTVACTASTRSPPAAMA